MERSATRDLIVGLFVLSGLVAIGYLSISVGGFRMRQTAGMKLTAAFDETGGLSVGAPVVIGGIRVGRVAQLTLGDDFRALGDLELDRPLKLPVDTSAAIVTAGVLGDRYIELTPGGDDQMLKDGDRIGFTESAVILEKLIGQFIYGSTKGKNVDLTTRPSK